MHMNVVTFLNAEQHKFLRQVKELGGSLRAASAMSEISMSTLSHWQEDPDFKMACDAAIEEGRGVLEAGALIALQRNLSAGKLEAAKMTLVAMDPELWNPAQRLEVDLPKHRFIGFDGKDIHTGEVIDGEVIPSESSGTPLEQETAEQ